MLKTVKVVGLNSDQKAALALVCQSHSGSLLMLVAAEVEDAFSQVKQAIVAAEDLFFLSVKPLGERVNEVFAIVSEHLKAVNNLQVLIAAIDEKDSSPIFYLLCQGENLIATLWRNKEETDLVAVSSNQLISGFLQLNDRIILTTKSLENFLGDEFSKLFSWPTEVIEDEVNLRIPQAQIAPLATIVVDYLSEEKEVEEKMEREKTTLSFSFPQLSLEAPARFFKRAFFRLTIGSNWLKLAIPALILILIIGGLIFKNRQDQTNQATAQQILQKAEIKYQEALSLQESNSTLASQSLQEASQLVEEILKTQPKNGPALDLKKQITDKWGIILKVYQVEPSLWLDLDLVKKGLMAQKMSLSLGKVLILDPILKVLVSLDLSSKAPLILAGEEKMGEGKFASLNGVVAWVFSENKGLLRLENNQLTTIKKDEKWGQIVDIYGFAGNIYLLDEKAATGSGQLPPEAGQVWKYLPTASGYSEAREYLKGKADFSHALRMQIDSSIWVLKQGGEILKFTQGAKDFFALSGLDKGVKDPKSFFISDKTDHLYLLDSGNQRLLVLSSGGEYLSQYQSEKFADFTDLVVDEQNKKVYFLEGSKIFQIELR